ncbi:MAG TPA: TolC family protein [Polyangia bacterium]
MLLSAADVSLAQPTEAVPSPSPSSASSSFSASPPPTARTLPRMPAVRDYVTPDYLRKPPSLPPHLEGRRPKALTLAEAIETSLRRNLAIAFERERVREIETARSLALSAFEPTLQANAGRNRRETPPLTRQEGQAGQTLESTEDFWNLSLRERLPTGTELRLDFSNSRAKSSLGTAVAPELFRSGLSLGVVQPLLRDFSFTGRVQRAPVLRAQFASETAKEDARLRALLTVKATEDAYWSLVESWKTYEVNVLAYGLAEDQLALTRRQIGAGLLPDSDVIAVEGTVAQRQLAAVRAEAQIERAADQLRALLNLPPGEWEQPILPVDAPGFVHIELPFADALAKAESHRPEFGRARIDLRRIALDLQVAKNARLPRLDLNGSVGTVGQDQEYERALDQVSERKGPQWGVGVTLGWAPLGVGARAEIRRLESAARNNEIGREQLLLEMRTQIREALRAIETAERQLYASAKFRDLAERSLDVEQRRFLNGLSSNFFIAQRQAELAEARLSELGALIQHEKASSDLQLATGQLLEARQLKFDLRGG